MCILNFCFKFNGNFSIKNNFFKSLNFADDIKIKIRHQKAFNGENNETFSASYDVNNVTTTTKDDLEFTKNETIHFNECDFQLLCGHIMETERAGLTEEEPIRQEENACVLWNHVPEELTLEKMASSISYKFVMAVDVHEADVRQEMIDGNVKFT